MDNPEAWRVGTRGDETPFSNQHRPRVRNEFRRLEKRLAHCHGQAEDPPRIRQPEHPQGLQESARPS